MSTHQLITQSLSEKAWHVVSLILSLGRQARLSDVASRCTLFDASPEFIQFLCLIPNSPISLTSDLLVTLSPIALPYFAEYVARNFFQTDVSRPGSGCSSRLEDLVRLDFRKRKQLNDNLDGSEVPLLKRIRSASSKVHYHITDGISGSTTAQRSNWLGIVDIEMMLKPPVFLKFSRRQLSCKIEEISHVKGNEDINSLNQRRMPRELKGPKCDSESALPARLLDHDVHVSKIFSATYNLEDVKQSNISGSGIVIANDASKASNNDNFMCEKISTGKEEESFIDFGSPKEAESLVSPFNSLSGFPDETESQRINTVNCDGHKPSLDKDHVAAKAIIPTTLLSDVNEHLAESSTQKNISQRDYMNPKLQALVRSVVHSKASKTHSEKQHSKRDQISVRNPQKTNRNNNNVHIDYPKGNDDSISPKVQPKAATQPNFESYVVEEEEGSGGYGTVYRARRKHDGTVVAIKCPHANANRHHVSNEIRMLERFGGRNCIVKYEGCFKNGDSDCIVLEHFAHDRPEVLKKEIDVTQIQWYGYCMFRALASLHKQGTVHRDVKPGNFLFSRKASKGYLIDFNLALDLRQKLGIMNKSRVGDDTGLNHVNLSGSKHITTNRRKVQSAKPLDAVKEASKGSNLTLEPKKLKRKAVGQTRAYNDFGTWSVINSQGADGSGITSAKDVTSTRTHSAERMREPLPCHGRKELLNLLQKAMRSPNHEAMRLPAPMGKRVAAPLGKVDRELIYPTPMPLHSRGTAVAGGGMMNNKGSNKPKKEGPCSGTKGFRAPEVLFRSQHQGPKIDIWSAGVTLLYLMIGRTPFFGDPEQNIKDIAKFRGSEDLWEVAKLHDREASFPEELFDTKYLASMNLRDWCQLNAKRQDFLETIPSSLFDLVDKCLTVNPRLRLSAEDALKHEFFTPCYESLRKQKLLRQGTALENRTSNSLQRQSTAKVLKISQ